MTAILAILRVIWPYLLGAALVAGAMWWIHSYGEERYAAGHVAGMDEVIKSDRDAVEAQRRKDEAAAAIARKNHEDEMAQAGLGYAALLRDLDARRLRDVEAARRAGAAQAHPVDQGGSTGDGAPSCQVPDYPDLRYAIVVFAHRLDELNAAAREVNEVSQ